MGSREREECELGIKARKEGWRAHGKEIEDEDLSKESNLLEQAI